MTSPKPTPALASTPTLPASQGETTSRTLQRKLPPRPGLPPATPEELRRQKLQREEKDAQVRGVRSICAMREAIRQRARSLPVLSSVEHVGQLDADGFRQRAAAGLPFLYAGLVKRWPLFAMPAQLLREQYGMLTVRARVGDYVNTAFAPDRAMLDMTMHDYLNLIDQPWETLPPYLGNLELRAFNRLCHWPAYFSKMGPPRFWIGPAGTVTPLHCDYDDNVFAQIWGSKRIFLAPPHYDEFLYPREANAILFGSPINPEAPDFDRFPLARQAHFIECIVNPGDLLYVPAGWYHQVRALTFSLSCNRWARGVPLALDGEAALKRRS
ncbi:MAG: cupin-like domain-containing protein [Janthinobacterium lividum]